MAFDFIKKKKGGGEPEDDGAPESASESVEASPAKARAFFERAQTIHDTASYEYAMTMWLQGIRLDPNSVTGLEKYLLSAGRFAGSSKKPKGPTSNQKKQFTGRGGAERYLRALLDWGVRQLDWQQGIKAMEGAARIGANEPAYEIGTRVLGVAANDPKAKKDAFVSLMRLFQKVGGYDKAVIAGEQAVRRDPTDAKLTGEVKNMSARATMSEGGYEETGQSGGFRANVRDTTKQQELEEDERIVKTEDVLERGIRRAIDDYKLRPTDNAAIQKAAKMLRERAKDEDLKMAYQILMKGYETNQNYRFKMGAGDIKLLRERRKLMVLRQKLEESPGDEGRRHAVTDGQKKLMRLEIEEFKERVQNMPADLKLRYELARRCLQVGEYETAIENFQQATNSPQVAPQSRRGLAESFSAVGWLDEAESTYREAISEHHSDSDDEGTALRYGLMSVLENRARESSDLSAAEEAFKLASGIAIKRIGFKDIRERRNAIQELVKSLKPASASP